MTQFRRALQLGNDGRIRIGNSVALNVMRTNAEHIKDKILPLLS
jgi:hypothetical protein